MTEFNDFLHEQMKDSAFAEEYKALEPEFAIVQAMIDARKTSGLTQKELAEKTGIQSRRYQQVRKMKVQILPSKLCNGLPREWGCV